MLAQQILDREFLEIRAKILELAAALDRLERAEGSVADDPRMDRIIEGLQILQSTGTDRAERVQLAFSLPYQPGWQSTLPSRPR